ncbi:hypothetical protein [Ectobacillus ponti]|uniref:Spore coat protein n=1 Tax=Ectobacillus ponti TaxID=2961894 RepID=A0AA41X2C7_9BACI|nr:hypothetical protein [Ectobacillus ponti]MCP8967649.1 hypothetical protein [Ectobacillus ponti]
MNSTYVKELKRLLGNEVQVNFAGPEKGKGKLRTMRQDYCAVECKDGIYYYSMQHVKSINTVGKKEDGKDEAHHAGCQEPLFSGFSFQTLLVNMKGHRVTINRKLKGIVVGASKGNLILEHEGETMFVPLYHIQSVTLDKEKKEQKQEESQ